LIAKSKGQRVRTDTRICALGKERYESIRLRGGAVGGDNPRVKLLIDCFGREIRLTDERLAHILEHPEIKTMGAEIGPVVSQPKFVRRSRSDPAVRLFYDFCPETPVSSKWLCVVVKYYEDDAFVITAYLTDRPKPGENLWPTE
jgi:hypothetical protein